LIKVLTAWPLLPNPIRIAILAMIDWVHNEPPPGRT
jgi:hypothetical protein